ncbi:cupredoxin domain-containing protein [Paenibacillus sp. HB172176]|uniref:cupredoxin domain-containing protein n=1 Tax=Paenibacillus sp. HB172176 TaxID=2493690 RepID=UPI00143AC644|nr:cupredoxin domain-containing protein [Paenibacillus sp. HB172176]
MLRKKIFVYVCCALSLMVVLSACGNNNNNNKNGNNTTNTATNQPSPEASAPAAGGETKEITVDAKNFEFTPNDIQLHVGDTVKLTLNNTVGNHGLEIPDLNVNLTNGQTATFTVDKAGTYDFNCSIQCGAGHDNMTGTITVS